MIQRLAVGLSVFTMMAVAAGPVYAGATPAQKCASAKIKLAGKKAACLLNLDAGEEAKAVTKDPLKVQKCKDKLSSAFVKTDGKGGCALTGDGQTIENKVDAFVADIDDDLSLCNDAASSPCRKCQSAKLKNVGKKAACLTGLKAKEAAGGGLDPLKVQKCKDKFSSAYVKLDGKGGCVNPGDFSVEEPKVDSFSDDVFSEIPSSSPGCTPIVPNQPIPNTYKLQGTTGGSNEFRCTTGAAANRFGSCTSDAQCGNTVGACKQLPWVTADGQEMPFSATATTFTVAAEGSYPTCEHALCIPCGNPHASCAGIPACEVKRCNLGTRINLTCTTDDTNATTGCPGATCPGCCVDPNGCIPRGEQGCCNQPGFLVPTFTVNVLGGVCSRVDQIDCGVGVVNTSNPQTGDNDVKKDGDTSDPGPDCVYGNGDDVPKACTVAGAGGDYSGKIVRTIGNGSADANGIHFRLQTPELSTTWMDSMNPCPQGSTFDDGESIVSQILIKAEPTSAGASGSFTEMNGDACKRVGSGFTAALPDGPIVVPGAPAGPLRPQSYDGTVGAVTGTVSEVFSGPSSPIHDIGFVAITPVMPAQIVASQSCTCNVVPGCPE
jgi:hypothetical protein